MSNGRLVTLRDGSKWRVSWKGAGAVGARAEGDPLPEPSPAGIYAEREGGERNALFIADTRGQYTYDFPGVSDDELREILESFRAGQRR